jgi:hypothetical protein
MTPSLELIARVVEALVAQRGGVQKGDEVCFRCVHPEAHRNGDANPSAWFNTAKGAWHCKGCTAKGGLKDIAQRLGLRDADRIGQRETARWTIRDPDGTPVAVHIRLEPGKKGEEKDCFWYQADGTTAGLHGRKLRDLPLYGCERLAARPGEQVVVVEGEKAADALLGRNVLAVGTVTGASGTPSDAVLRVLEGRPVVLWPDADPIGRQHMAKIAARLAAIDITHQVADPWPDRTDGSDAADFDGVDEALRAALDQAQDTPADPVGPIDLAALLDDVHDYLLRYVVFTAPAQAVACALWVAHTHAFDAAEVTPYLHASSPEKRSGKSKLLDVLQEVAAHPWRCVEPSTSALYRKVEAQRPTLLLDEVDAIFAGKPTPQTEGLRGVLNAGFEISGVVSRCGGKNFEEVLDFSAFCPKVLAGIGSLPGTIVDRAIPIKLKRKRAGDAVEKFRRRLVKAETAALRTPLEAWGARAVQALRAATPDVPHELDDRAADMWEPLLAIADLAGGRWPAEARRAARALHGGRDESDGDGVLLLGAIRAIFEKHDGCDKMLTIDLLHGLVAREGEPWGGAWGRAVDEAKDGMTPKRPAMELAKLLRPFEVIPKEVRCGEAKGKGYDKGDFTDAWDRYLPLKDAKGRDTATTHGAQGFEASRPTPGEKPVATPETHGAQGLSRCRDLNGKTRGDAANGALTGPPHDHHCPTCGRVDRGCVLACSQHDDLCTGCKLDRQVAGGRASA